MTERPAAARKGALDILEYLLRVAFFALVPFGVVLLAMLVPMTAAVANMCLALSAFFFGEVLQDVAEKRPWLRRVLRRQLAFEAYYRENRPRPFLYYVFYPLLLPYWVIVPSARREFWIFKGYTLVTITIVSIAGVYRYFFVYQPQLGFRDFVIAFGIGLVIETLAVMTLIMPMTTSIVALHQQRQKGRLVGLLAVGVISTSVALYVVDKRHRTFPSLETRQRIVRRSAVDRNGSRAAMKHALDKAWKSRHAPTSATNAWERETDGTLEGAPVEEARTTLGAFYRADEAAAFELWTTSTKERPSLMIVFAEGRRRGTPVWLGMRGDGVVVDKLADVPRSARQAMRTAGDL